jgi:hypothetical protein
MVAWSSDNHRQSLQVIPLLKSEGRPVNTGATAVSVVYEALLSHEAQN